ncbi:MAG: Fe-S protein assembly co-chaperone HscB [Pseudomonadota bacterium]
MNTKNQNYFELFDIHPSYPVEATQLDKAYRELQIRFHPDNLKPTGDESASLEDVTLSSLVNDAYQTLQDPVRCLIYILSLNEIDVNLEANTIADPEFLMQQMELREQLENIDEQSENVEAEIEHFASTINQSVEALLATIPHYLTGLKVNDTVKVREFLMKLQFLIKLQQEIDTKLDQLDDL